jgi:hypothetical protein
MRVGIVVLLQLHACGRTALQILRDAQLYGLRPEDYASARVTQRRSFDARNQIVPMRRAGIDAKEFPILYPFDDNQTAAGAGRGEFPGR